VFLDHLEKENLKKLFGIKNAEGTADRPKSAPSMGISRCQITLKLFDQCQSTQKMMPNNRTIALFSRKKYPTDLNFSAPYWTIKILNPFMVTQ